jgi:beta-lactamase regulating signal transducer with metallopeptidase domain
MNDLGLLLAWLAVQSSLLLAPALLLNTLASRRGPAAGARVAVWSLGLVVALNAAAFVPRASSSDQAHQAPVEAPEMAFETAPRPTALSNGPSLGAMDPAFNRGWIFKRLTLAWDRLGRRAAEPPMQVRPWGTTLAVVALAGIAIGLLQLTIGLWAVALCCRRGRPVADPAMTELLQELRTAMGCRRPVALREVSDLVTPATARRRRPVLFLPQDWRTWSPAQRRAVLAHELAHIVRGDYPATLLARFAVALNYFHPLVRWMVARLQLQQELAADAIGARFGGGATSYLVALSSLALSQDRRAPWWPARAFLPARGTLVRRITMLRKESSANRVERPLSRGRRVLTVLALLTLTIGIATLRGPARGADDSRAPTDKAGIEPPPLRETSRSFAAPFVRAGMDGVAVFRPASAFRHPGMDRFLALCQAAIDQDLTFVGKKFKVDPSKQGFLRPRLQDVEWFTAAIGIDRFSPQATHTKERHAKNTKDHPLHTLSFGSFAVRMVSPFDWPAFLRQWRLECKEAQAGGHVYYKIEGDLKPMLGPNPCMLLLDDRTVVFDEENAIRQIAGRSDPTRPEYVTENDWARASRGLVAVAIDNRTDAFAKHYNLGRTDDAIVLSLFKGLNCWILGVEDADEITLYAQGACRDGDSAGAVCRSVDSLIKLGRQHVEQNAPKVPDVGAHDHIARLLKALAATVRVERSGYVVAIRAHGFGTLADFALIVDGEAQEAKARSAARDVAKSSARK